MDPEAVKRERHPARGQAVECLEDSGPTPNPNNSNVLQDIIGSANESPALVNNVSCTCLVDTGSQVTTISQSFMDLYYPIVSKNLVLPELIVILLIKNPSNYAGKH